MSVSCVISTVEISSKLIETIKSIENQTYTEIEIILVNDGYEKKSFTAFIDNNLNFITKKISIIHNNKNEGLTKSLIAGVNYSKCDYISRLDVGDYWDSGKLERQVWFLEQNPEVFLVGTQVYYVSEQPCLPESVFPHSHQEILRWLRMGRGPFEHSSILFRNCGINYDPLFYYAQDFDLYSRIALRHAVANINVPLTFVLTNTDGITAKRSFQQLSYRLASISRNFKGKKLKLSNVDKIRFIKNNLFIRISNYFYKKSVSKKNSMFLKINYLLLSSIFSHTRRKSLWNMYREF